MCFLFILSSNFQHMHCLCPPSRPALIIFSCSFSLSYLGSRVVIGWGQSRCGARASILRHPAPVQLFSIHSRSSKHKLSHDPPLFSNIFSSNFQDIIQWPNPASFASVIFTKTTLAPPPLRSLLKARFRTMMEMLPIPAQHHHHNCLKASPS